MNPIQIVSIIVAGVLSFTPMSAIKDNKDAIALFNEADRLNKEDLAKERNMFKKMFKYSDK